MEMVVTPRQSMPGHPPQSSAGSSSIIISVQLYEVRHLKQKGLSHKIDIKCSQVKEQVQCIYISIRRFIVCFFPEKE